MLIIFHETYGGDVYLKSFGEHNIFISSRGLVESFLIIFNTFYYLVIGCYLIASKRDFAIFLRWISLVLFMSLFVGYVDLIFKVFGTSFLGRHIASYPEISDIGFRFHGLFGEPRDAVFPLLFGLVLLLIGDGFRPSKVYFQKLAQIFGFVCAIFLTFSISGYLGILLGVCLFAVHISRKGLSIGFQAIAVSILGFGLILIFSSFARTQYYIEVYGALGVYGVDVSQLTSDELTQMFNIFPIVSYVNGFLEGNIVRTIFGYGVGYSAYLNNQFGLDGVAFPSSEGVRILVERGVLGLFLFTLLCYQFVTVFERLEGSNKVWTCFLTFCLIGVSLAHRTHGIWFLFLIILLCDKYVVKKIKDLRV